MSVGLLHSIVVILEIMDKFLNAGIIIVNIKHLVEVYSLENCWDNWELDLSVVEESDFVNSLSLVKIDS